MFQLNLSLEQLPAALAYVSEQANSIISSVQEIAGIPSLLYDWFVFLINIKSTYLLILIVSFMILCLGHLFWIGRTNFSLQGLRCFPGKKDIAEPIHPVKQPLDPVVNAQVEKEMANTPQPKKRKRKIRRNNTFLDGRWIHWKTKLYREEREMNIGVIGYGNIAKRFAQSIKHTKNGKVSAIGSKSLARDTAFQTRHPEIQVYETYDALLADPTIEGIYIALPHAFHKEWALKALALNIPVLCEKPAVLTVADMDEIIDAATAHETLFVEAFKTKYNTGFQQLKQAMNTLGQINRIEASFCSDVMPARNDHSYLFQKGQGGALNDVGSYPIGFVLALVDAPLVKLDSQRTLVDDIDTYFSATLMFDNGIEAFVEGGIDREKDRVARIIGEHGEITIPFFYRLEKYTVHLNGKEAQPYEYPLVGDDMTLEIQQFIDLVQAHQTQCPVHNLTDTKQMIAVMEAIRIG